MTIPPTTAGSWTEPLARGAGVSRPALALRCKLDEPRGLRIVQVRHGRVAHDLAVEHDDGFDAPNPADARGAGDVRTERFALDRGIEHVDGIAQPDRQVRIACNRIA